MMPMRELPEWVRPGAAFVLQLGDTKQDHRKFHIRGIVDDMAVIREWWWHKRRWHYEVKSYVYFWANGPFIKVVRR